MHGRNSSVYVSMNTYVDEDMSFFIIGVYCNYKCCNLSKLHIN